MLKTIVGAVTVAFGILSLFALYESGYWGLFAGQLGSLAGMQVLGDLVISCSLLLFFIWRDAHKNGRAFWPYAALTLAAGSFGPLLYLLLRPSRKAKDTPSAAPNEAPKAA
jgi:hypothetical protein